MKEITRRNLPRSEFGQSKVTYYGGQIGLNVALGAPPEPILTKE